MLFPIHIYNLSSHTIPPSYLSFPIFLLIQQLNHNIYLNAQCQIKTPVLYLVTVSDYWNTHFFFLFPCDGLTAIANTINNIPWHCNKRDYWKLFSWIKSCEVCRKERISLGAISAADDCTHKQEENFPILLWINKDSFLILA